MGVRLARGGGRCFLASMKPDGNRPRFGKPASAGAPVPSQPQNAAILKLLGDEDASTVKLVLQQLLADRRTARPRIEGLLREASGAAAGELRSALQQLRRSEALETLRARCARIETLAELEDFCWKLALARDPLADIEEARFQLDAWAAAVRSAVAPGASEMERLEALRDVLAEEVGLRGNAEQYYDRANSFLDRVIATRRGIPISLTAVYMLVGARADIVVEPIGMPGHFLARVGNSYLDPFHEGLVVDGEALRALLQKTGEPEADRALDVALPLHLMAQRMVVNLINIDAQDADAPEDSPWPLVLGWLRGMDRE